MEEAKLAKVVKVATEMGKSCMRVSRNFAIFGLIVLGVAMVADYVRESLEWMDYDDDSLGDYSFMDACTSPDSTLD